MPIGRAARLCPEGVFLPVDRDKYVQVSAALMAILADFTPLVEPLSIDEAFLDVTASRALLGDGRHIAIAIKSRVRSELALTASVGVASNKFVAKVASDLEKPDGLVVVPPGDEEAFLASLPVSRLWGVGRVTAADLAAMGVQTIGQLARVGRRQLEARFGSSGAHLAALARGQDDRAVEADTAPKSMGAEETFDHDHSDVGTAGHLRSQAERVAQPRQSASLRHAQAALRGLFHDHAGPFHGSDRRRAAHLPRSLCPVRPHHPPPTRQTIRLRCQARPGSHSQLAADPAAARVASLARAVDRLAGRFGESGEPASLLDARGRSAAQPW
jgi:DNA polymerase-4